MIFGKRVEIEDGYIGVISQNGRTTKFLKSGKYILSRSEQCTYKIPLNPQVVSDNHRKDGMTRTKDGEDIGFSYDIECQVIDPKLFYRKKAVGLDFHNTKKAVYDMLRRRIKRYTQQELIDTMILNGNGCIELSGNDLLDMDDPSAWGVTVTKVIFRPHVQGSHYEYWATFREYAQKLPGFTDKFVVPAVDHDEIINLWSPDRRYTINLWRDQSKNRVCVEVLIANSNGYFEKLVARETEIEHKLNWDIDWFEQSDRAFSIVRMAMKTDEKSMDQSKWNDQFEWMTEKASTMKDIVSDIMNSCHKLDTDDLPFETHSTRKELVECICKHCGAPLNTTTKMCRYCGMGHIEVEI